MRSEANHFDNDLVDSVYRSRDAVWGMLSMVLIVGGLILGVLYTRMWKTRHETWINIQEPLPPLKVSLKGGSIIENQLRCGKHTFAGLKINFFVAEEYSTLKIQKDLQLHIVS